VPTEHALLAASNWTSDITEPKESPNYLTPWNRDLLEKLTGTQVIEKFRA